MHRMFCSCDIVLFQVSATEGHVRGQAKTVAEALAFLKGEGTVKPDYERVAMTVAVVSESAMCIREVPCSSSTPN